MILVESVLVESRTARDNQLECISHERATEALNRAKALLFASGKVRESQPQKK